MFIRRKLLIKGSFFLAKYARDLDVIIELSTWEDAGTFKAKYALNAENFKCNILSIILIINLILMGCRTILTERTFEQCLATES